MALGVILLIVGLYGLGHAGPPDNTVVYVHSAAAALLLIAATSCARVRTCLDVPLGRLLGQYSFAIYLLHVLILMSLGMLTFLLLLNLMGHQIAVTISILTTILGTLAVSYLMVRFELWWLPVVHSVTALVPLGRPSSP